ncbi:MAG: class I SAM-dependent methyltransferase [Xenococcaceae cyanobacterium MO_167.B27]|nr:class I SAM-dependent methyltransferase [Xenococcaceae cyanobacterium MO_167.B27]
MSNSEPIKLEYWYSRDLEQRKNWYSNVAENYNKARPLYPQELINRVVELAQLSSDSTILEIGCGSGQATRGFAPVGLSMVCLEPSFEASQLAKKNCLSYPGVTINNTSLEEWELQTGKFDAVLAANAWHWLPPEVSYPKSAQALKTGGNLIVLWNMSPNPSYEIYQELDKVYQLHAPHLSRYETPQDQENILQNLGYKITDSQYFCDLQSEHFLQEVTYTIDDYLLLLQTFSPYLELPSSKRELLFSELKKTLEKHSNESLTVSYLSAFDLAKVNKRMRDDG